MKLGTMKTGLVYWVILLILAGGVPTVLAAPAFQTIPCFEGENCPEHVNPEAEEYFTIQCASNAVWVWRSIPAPTLISAIPVIQIEALTDNTPQDIPIDITVIRTGDTITVAGSNGNLAPQPGSKSFSFNDCIEGNGGPLTFPTPPALTLDHQFCLSLPNELEVTQCLGDLADSGSVDVCDYFTYRESHMDECNVGPSSLEILFSIVNACFNQVAIVAGIVSFAVVTGLRMRK